MDRRALLGAGAALAATSAFAADAKFSGRAFKVPDGACDCHHHIYDPRWSYIPGAALTPPPAPVADYRKVQHRLGTSRDVVVQPSSYGTDNRCLLDVLKQLGDGCRGVCVVNSRVSDAALKALHAAGVRGLRIQFGLGNPVSADEVRPLARRIHELGWHIQINMPPEQLTQMEPVLRALPVPVMIDHLGRATASNQPQYAAVRRLLDGGRCWVKLSGATLVSQAPDGRDVTSAALGYVRAAPERCVWGSDWPHPESTRRVDPVPMPDDMAVLNRLAQWATTEKLRHRILVENPESFYGFDPARRPKAL
ncbi:MAG TPA: amidohydrolase family protein [Rhizomicrobium sp.]|nr:amidohydrolase family protein [Rhizomicrobium sp.]